MKRNNYILESARTLGLAILRPNFPVLPQIPRLLATRMDMTTFCLVPSMAASQARLSSSSSALDFAISASRSYTINLETSMWDKVGCSGPQINMDLHSRYSGICETSPSLSGSQIQAHSDLRNSTHLSLSYSNLDVRTMICHLCQVWGEWEEGMAKGGRGGSGRTRSPQSDPTGPAFIHLPSWIKFSCRFYCPI